MQERFAKILHDNFKEINTKCITCTWCVCFFPQAYWNVATKRLVDNVCMTMEQDFVVKLLGKVESELFLLTNRYTDVEELFVEVREKKKKQNMSSEALLSEIRCVR